MAEQEYSSQPLVLGVQGLDLKRTIDQVSPLRLTRMTNLIRDEEGALTVRPGLTAYVTAGAGNSDHHTLCRMQDPIDSSYVRFVGVDSSLYYGTTGAFALAGSGFSGSPLSFAPHRPPLSSDAWLYVGDTARNAKARASDGLFLSIGLPAPPSTPGLSYLSKKTKTIDSCETATWTNNDGTGGTPANTTSTDRKAGTYSTLFTSAAGASAYYNFWSKAVSLDLSYFTVGDPITDDDIIHLWMKVDNMSKVTEVRIYFVCSAVFDTTVVPGSSAAANGDSYVQSFRPSDFAPYYAVSSTNLTAASTVNTNEQTLGQLATTTDSRTGDVALIIQQREAAKGKSVQMSPGQSQWTEFGTIGIPLHRRDFRRLGSDFSRDWSTITGLVVVMAISDTTNAVNLWLDDIYATGGAGLDSSLVGNQAYDYRYINYDPRTGDKSNPSDEMSSTGALDSLRQGISVKPSAYGDANIRQRFFRRGGTLNSNWYYCGENTADGAAFDDTLSDLAIVAAGTLETDNDQPVTTVDRDGNAVYAQPIACIFGPVQDMLFGCGDPYRAGNLYWCKPGQPGSWPLDNTVEVCPPAEELMGGCVWQGQPYVFSRERGFSVFPNLQTSGQVNTIPNGCKHGFLARWTYKVGPGGIYFVAKDGIYRTAGGPEENLSDDVIMCLFRGEAKNGYAPIDFTVPEQIKLEIFDNELWFLYQDTSGQHQVMLYSLLFKFWHSFNFKRNVSSMYAEEYGTGRLLLLGSRDRGTTYQYSGYTDDGDPIDYLGRTGSLDQDHGPQNKTYGDALLEMNLHSNQVRVTGYLNDEEDATPPFMPTVLTGKQAYVLDIFDPDKVSRSVAIEFSGSSSSSTPPQFYVLTIHYILRPFTQQGRVTDWDSAGILADKWVKGFLIECDTGGNTKSLEVQADGVTQCVTTVASQGRRIVHVSFPQFRGRLLRVKPNNIDGWLHYGQVQWLFDQEPYELDRWETQETDNGFPGWQTLMHSWIALRSSAKVTLTVQAYGADGTYTTFLHKIASTNGVKKKVYVPLGDPGANPASIKGLFFKYIFTSTASFWLYREESTVWFQPWGGQGPRESKPFGNDDLGASRGMTSASLAAARSGGTA